MWERADFPPTKIKAVLGNDTLAMLGYGPQGRGQALNARDAGCKVIIGLRKGGSSWASALKDGWKEGVDLLPVLEAAQKGTIIMYLLSDAGQKEMWPALKPCLTKGKTLYFSHGFSIVYKEDTLVVPPPDIDVILVAPKGSGYTLRTLALEGRGLNSSVAVFQDATGTARQRAFAIGAAIGSGYMYETTFQKVRVVGGASMWGGAKPLCTSIVVSPHSPTPTRQEVYSDLVGERGALMGAIQGLFAAQYATLRARGHSVSESFNETVVRAPRWLQRGVVAALLSPPPHPTHPTPPHPQEEATQSLYPLIAANGMDWMYANCSTTAQRGALDWAKPFEDATRPVFEKLYDSVARGDETRRTLTANSRPNYRAELEKELAAMRDSEMWRAGKTVRSLRPENIRKAEAEKK